MDGKGPRFSHFAKLWALATLFHQSKLNAWTASMPEIALTLGAFLLIFSKVTVLRFAAFLVLQIVVIFSQAPWLVSNHWIFTFFIALTGLIAWLIAARKEANLSPSSGTWLSEFSPSAGIQLLTLYFFATFHKLNTGFLDQSSSCAVAQYQELRKALSFFPAASWAQVSSIYLTLIFEAGIPFLLIFRRTRFTGVVLALIFHTLLGINNFFDFSTMLFALLFLFAPVEIPFLSKFDFRPAWAISLATALTFLTSLMSKTVSTYLGISAGLVYAIVLIALLFSQRKMKLDFSFALRNVFAVVPLLLVVINGLSPYLGLKTESSFAMFSNLRTEAGQWNYLVMPNLQIFGFQNDLVQILEAKNGPHEFDKIVAKWVPYQAVQSVFDDSLGKAEKLKIRYKTFGGEVHTLQNDTNTLQPKTHYLLRKFLLFRPIYSIDDNLCHH